MENQSSECQTIVMEYLLHYNYKNSAKALLKDLNHLDDCTKQPGRKKKMLSLQK